MQEQCNKINITIFLIYSPCLFPLGAPFLPNGFALHVLLQVRAARWTDSPSQIWEPLHITNKYSNVYSKLLHFMLQEQRWSQRICIFCIKVSLHTVSFVEITKVVSVEPEKRHVHCHQVYCWEGRDSHSLRPSRTHLHSAPWEGSCCRVGGHAGISRKAWFQRESSAGVYPGTAGVNVSEYTPLHRHIYTDGLELCCYFCNP